MAERRRVEDSETRMVLEHWEKVLANLKRMARRERNPREDVPKKKEGKREGKDGCTGKEEEKSIGLLNWIERKNEFFFHPCSLTCKTFSPAASKGGLAAAAVAASGASSFPGSWSIGTLSSSS